MVEALYHGLKLNLPIGVIEVVDNISVSVAGGIARQEHFDHLPIQRSRGTLLVGPQPG